MSTTPLQTYLRLTANPLDLLKECTTLNIEELQRHGADFTTAHSLHHLSETYYGEHPWASPAIQAIGKSQHTLESLNRIEHHVRRTKIHKWRLRLALCRVKPEHVDKTAQRWFKENRPHKKPQEGMRVIRRTSGSWTLAITGSAEIIGDIEALITAETDPHTSTSNSATPDSASSLKKKILRHSPNSAAGSSSMNNVELFEPTIKGAAEALHGLCTAGGASRPVITIHAVMPLEEACNIMHGRESDHIFRLSNGVQLSGTELVKRGFAECGITTVVDQIHGPVNAYRWSRYANSKQRIMLSALYPECAWPECHIPADQCQYHHIKPWKYGGLTNLDNLVPLCTYHNGINDDDETGKRGRISRTEDGNIKWIPPSSNV